MFVFIIFYVPVVNCHIIIKKDSLYLDVPLEGTQYSVFLGMFAPEYWKGGSNRLLNLGFIRSRMVFVLLWDQGTRLMRV